MLMYSSNHLLIFSRSSLAMRAASSSTSLLISCRNWMRVIPASKSMPINDVRERYGYAGMQPGSDTRKEDAGVTHGGDKVA